MSRVLLLSISVGTGHTRAADAVQEGLKRIRPETQTAVVDAFAYANPLLGKVLVGTYMEAIRFTPRVYRFLYTMAEGELGEPGKTEFSRLLNLLMATRLLSFLGEFQPEAVACTHPFPLGVMSVLRKRGHFDRPLIGVITDYSVHPFWLFGNVDRYCVAAPPLREELLRRGVPAGRVEVTGIPILPKEAGNLSRAEARARWGFTPGRPLVLVMGGGLGLGPLEGAVKALADLQNIQVAVVAGKNEKLAARLSALETRGPRVRVFGYLEHVDELMDAADLIVTKPGGLTSAEALARGLPIVVLDPIPGQEERNTEFLLRQGVAVRVKGKNALTGTVSELLRDRRQLGTMQKAALALGRPDAALAVARGILAAIENA